MSGFVVRFRQGFRHSLLAVAPLAVVPLVVAPLALLSAVPAHAHGPSASAASQASHASASHDAKDGKKAPLPFRVDWGDLAEYFRIEKPRIVTKREIDDRGIVHRTEYLEFDVQARHEFEAIAFEGVLRQSVGGHQLDWRRYVRFERPPQFRWRPGQNAKASVEMPPNRDLFPVSGAYFLADSDPFGFGL